MYCTYYSVWWLVAKKIVKAGTPIFVNFGNLQADAAAAVGPTAGVFTLQITTAFAADEVITIAGVNYTCKAAEDVEGNKFAGADAAADNFFIEDGKDGQVCCSRRHGCDR